MTATLETLPLLSLVVLTPLAGAALVWLARSQRQARAIALGMMGAPAERLPGAGRVHSGV